MTDDTFDDAFKNFYTEPNSAEEAEKVAEKEAADDAARAQKLSDILAAAAGLKPTESADGVIRWGLSNGLAGDMEALLQALKTSTQTPITSLRKRWKEIAKEIAEAEAKRKQDEAAKAQAQAQARTAGDVELQQVKKDYPLLDPSMSYDRARHDGKILGRHLRDPRQ
ncbi:hypothetical protein [Rhizobium sp. RAF56]|uniref:hypothetical protein n=1 Tax=Rhizobium sp. RAF56 TaxID=3233062 RepID=UPI003F9BF951